MVDPDCPAALAGRPHLSPTRSDHFHAAATGGVCRICDHPENSNLLPIPKGCLCAIAALAEPSRTEVSWHAVRIGLERPWANPPRACWCRVRAAIGVAAALVGASHGRAQHSCGRTSCRATAHAYGRGGIDTFDPCLS